MKKGYVSWEDVRQWRMWEETVHKVRQAVLRIRKLESEFPEYEAELKAVQKNLMQLEHKFLAEVQKRNKAVK
jgi:Skp family chaperone for outer membrane proteins